MDLAEFIDARLEAMLSHPHTWGGPEAFELQVLLLLELRQFIRNSVTPSASLRNHLDAYSGFLRARHPELGPRPMSAVCEDVEAIAQQLDEFRKLLDVPSVAAPIVRAPSAPENLGTDVEVTTATPTKPRRAA